MKTNKQMSKELGDLEIFEGNRLIADSPFSHEGLRISISKAKALGESDEYIYGHFKFHCQWNLIVPASHRFLLIDISEFNYDAQRMAEFRMVRANMADMPIWKQIPDFFNELVAAIKWYNNSKKIK